MRTQSRQKGRRQLNMAMIKLNLDDGEGFLERFPDAYKNGLDKLVIAENNEILVGTLQGGMTSGNPSVGIFAKLPDGNYVFIETSVRLFQMAAAAMTGKYGLL